MSNEVDLHIHAVRFIKLSERKNMVFLAVKWKTLQDHNRLQQVNMKLPETLKSNWPLVRAKRQASIHVCC